MSAAAVIKEAVEEVLEWAPRVIRLIPVFRELWSGVKDQDQGKIFAAQMEMQRKIREEQARDEFLRALDDEPTAPGGP
jgi:GTP1/Obg family GTP-binding protein